MGFKEGDTVVLNFNDKNNYAPMEQIIRKNMSEDKTLYLIVRRISKDGKICDLETPKGNDVASAYLTALIPFNKNITLGEYIKRVGEQNG